LKKKDIVIYIGCIIAVILFYFCFRIARVEGSSMFPDLQNNNVLLVENVTPELSYDRFDIIIFQRDGFLSEKLIKRVIGLPGETIQIMNGNIYINGELLQDEYGYGTTYSIDTKKEPITLGDHEYFVMGDNRENSFDSRYSEIGPINETQVVGKVWVQVWPCIKLK